MSTPELCDDVFITRDLGHRPSRPPDYEAESRALGSLAGMLSADQDNVLSRLVEEAMALTRADTAGVSLLEADGEQEVVRWVALTGMWASHLDNQMPREASPCREVIARDAVLLIREPERAFPALRQRNPGIYEGLLAPLHVSGKVVGTLWAIKHRAGSGFEQEDARLLQSLSRIAAAGHQMRTVWERAEASHRDSEEKYRHLFESIDEGFCIVEVLFDDEGKPHDLLHVEANSAYERYTGLKNIVGKRAREIVPDGGPWLAYYGNVVRTGEPVRLEMYMPPAVDRWIASYLSRIGGDCSHKVAVVFNDITSRKQAEIAVRESEQRHAFLLRFTDAIRSEPNEQAVVARATRMLADELCLDRCYVTRLYPARDLTEVVHEVRGPGFAPIPSWLRNSDFPEAFRQTFERTLIFEDTANDVALTDTDKLTMASMQFGALLSRPLRREGSPVFALGAVSSRPRRWSPGEIALVEEVTERTWEAAERARNSEALRASEARLAAALESAPAGIAVVGLDGASVISNAEFRRFLPTGVVPSRDSPRAGRWRAWNPQGEPLSPEDFPTARALRGERVLPGQEMLYTSEDGREIWTIVSTVPIWDDGGQPVGAASVITDVDEQKRAVEGLRASEARFQQFANASADVLWIRDAQTLAATYVSTAANTVYGVCPKRLIGDQPFWDSLIVPEDRAAMIAQLEAGRRGEVSAAEFRVLRPSDGVFRFVRRTIFPLVNAQGRVEAIAGISSDVTETRLLSDHQGVLLAELQHRVRNIMAIIRSITARTAQGARTTEEYRDILLGRLLALARVQTFLTRAVNVSVGLRSILGDELRVQAQNENQFEMAGPDVTIAPKAAEVLTLAIHELATNAAKYGALSVPHGKVKVTWKTVERRGVSWLSIDWIEECVLEGQLPPEHERRRGFGSELIEEKVPYELKGFGRMAIDAGGARCHLEFPLKGGASVLETGGPQRASVYGGALDLNGEAGLSDRRVLVVEDDYFLATDVARALRSAGATVIGPSSTEEDAFAKLDKGHLDAVVLDINLGGTASFKLAEHLRHAGIPFVFLTGYDAEVIPAEFSAVARLEKPVQLRQIINSLVSLLR